MMGREEWLEEKEAAARVEVVQGGATGEAVLEMASLETAVARWEGRAMERALAQEAKAVVGMDKEKVEAAAAVMKVAVARLARGARVEEDSAMETATAPEGERMAREEAVKG